MNMDLEMGTRGVDRTNTAQDAPGVNHIDAQTANPTQLSGQQVAPGDAETANPASPPDAQVADSNSEGVGLSLPRALENIKSGPTPWTLPSGPSRLLLRMGHRVRERKDENVEGRLKIGILHQYNVLWARSRLLRHYDKPNELVDDEVAGRIQGDLQTYCKAEIVTRSHRRLKFTRTSCTDALYLTKQMLSETTSSFRQ
jgi:hypothetical protein